MLTMLKSIAFARGLNVSRQTEDREVAALLARLHPRDCGKKLIRVGGEGDGGYLIPDDLDGIEYCFSPGVSTVADFEDHLAELHIHSFLADYSVDSAPVVRPEFTFDKRFLGATDDGVSITLSTWKDKYLKHYRGDLLLQMDIEGAEYEVLLNTPDDLLRQFRILVIEFHELHMIFDPFVFKLFRSCFTKVLKYFQVAHIHPNNCCGSLRKGEWEIPRVAEMTLYNKQRIVDSKPRRDFPHPSDRDNVPKNRPLPLAPCWYE